MIPKITEGAPFLARFLREKWDRGGLSYNFPRNVLTTTRIALSLRRYHRHWPFLVASTSPALVKIAM